MKTPAAVAPLLACLAMPALAQEDAKELQLFKTVTYLGVPYPRGLDEDVEALYRGANAEPNQTRSVRFKPYSWFEEDEQLAQTEWTWRVNVTEFGLGNVATDDAALNPDGRNFSDPRVVNTVYDWAWPGGGDITAAVAAPGHASVCVTGLASFYFPSNVTNAYGADEADSASCAPVFGAACVEAILRSSGAKRSGSPADTQTCGDVDVGDWPRMPECAGSWGYAGKLQAGIGWVTIRLNAGDNSTAGEPSPPLGSGAGFWSLRTDAFEAGEEGPWLGGAANRLHVLLVETQVNTTRGPRSEPQLLCTRVATERLDEGVDETIDNDEDAAKDGDEKTENDGNGDEDQDDEESAAPTLSSGGGRRWWYVALLAGMALVV